MLNLTCYIVVEIPEPIRSRIQALRDALNTPIARLPVEITLAGSSGIGPIPPTADRQLVQRELDRLLAPFAPFSCQFAEITSFPDTSTYFLVPQESTPFDRLHLALRNSQIPFTPSRWPYHPHCTLRLGDPLRPADLALLQQMEIPRDPFQITTVSVYGRDESTRQIQLLWQQMLKT